MGTWQVREQWASGGVVDSLCSQQNLFSLLLTMTWTLMGNVQRVRGWSVTTDGRLLLTMDVGCLLFTRHMKFPYGTLATTL